MNMDGFYCSSLYRIMCVQKKDIGTWLMTSEWLCDDMTAMDTVLQCRDNTMGTIGTLLWTLDSWVVCKLIPTNWTHSPSLSLSLDGWWWRCRWWRIGLWREVRKNPHLRWGKFVEETLLLATTGQVVKWREQKDKEDIGNFFIEWKMIKVLVSLQNHWSLVKYNWSKKGQHVQ